jgi:hypothetical protein
MESIRSSYNAREGMGIGEGGNRRENSRKPYKAVILRVCDFFVFPQKAMLKTEDLRAKKVQ